MPEGLNFKNCCYGASSGVELGCAYLRFLAAGSPEAEGKAEYLTSVIETINKWQGSTIGLAKFFSLARGKLQRHRNGIREVHHLPFSFIPFQCLHSLFIQLVT